MIRSIILLVLGASVLVMAVRSLRAQRLKERYAILFFATGLPFLVLAFWPNGIVWLSTTLEINQPTVMILCLGIYVILLLFKLLSLVSVQERKIITLTQTVAILMEKQGLSRLGENEPK